MPIAKRHDERRKVAGVEVQEKLRRLKGHSRSDLVADRARGPASPLSGHRKKVEREKR
jgi:hypothetical protein